MEIKDHRGSKIKEGTTLKYQGTRTKGKADKICFKEKTTWIRLDTTGLYYRLDYLTVVSDEVNKNKTSRMNNKEKILQQLKKTSHKNYEISSDSDGPGVGGG